MSKHDYLKTKLTSLGAEVKLIRQYERNRYRKASKFELLNKDRSASYNLDTANGLREHRIKVVQPEARWSNIAYGFCRGRKYPQIEVFAYDEPDWDRIERLVLTFAERINPRYNQSVEERFKDWVDHARKYWADVAAAQTSEMMHMKKWAKPLEVDAVGNNQIGYMEPNSEYQLSLKAKERANYVPNTVCLDSDKGI
jgi:hypothetical protein